MTDDKNRRKSSHSHKKSALSETDLVQVAGGTQTTASGKKIITGAYSCQWFQAKESPEHHKEDSRFCSYCRHKSWEGAHMVCTHPYNAQQ